MNLHTAIATLLYVGRAPSAPGTFGSLAALPAAMLLHWAGRFPMLFVATLLVIAVGWWATARYMRETGRDDPPEVVIDEVAGQWIALWPLSAGLWWLDAPADAPAWPGLIAAFLLFRFFDIVKPPPVGWADRLPGATGVMLDDIVAGAISAALLLLAAAVAHGWVA